MTTTELGTVSTLSAWLQSQKSENTKKGYAGAIVAFGRWLRLDPELAAAELLRDEGSAHAMAHAYRAWMSEWTDDDGPRFSARTCNVRLAALRSLVKYSKLLRRTFWTLDVKDVAVPKGFRLRLDREKLAQLIETAPNARERAVLGLLGLRGCRIGSVAALRLQDVLRAPDGNVSLRLRMKGQTSATTVVMDGASLRFLEQWLAEGYVQGDTVFGMSEDSIRDMVRAAGERIGVQGLYPHALRGSFATNHLYAGTPLPVVMDLMNHSSPTTTLGYLNSDTDAQRAALRGS